MVNITQLKRKKDTMQILLASAKIMNGETTVSVPLSTKPLFVDDARRFAGELSRWSVEEIGAAMGCNAQIAAENKLVHPRIALASLYS